MILATVSNTARAEYMLLLAEVELNHLDKGQHFFLWDGASDFLAEVGDLIKWRIRKPYPEPVVHYGKTYHSLNSFPGISVVYEPSTVSLQLMVQTDLFQPQVYSLLKELPRASAGNGGFLDYDWSYTDGGVGRALSGYMAPTLFSSMGSLANDFLYRRNFGGVDLGESSVNGWVRLTTTYRFDDPGTTRRYAVGDVMTTPGPWGGWLRMGGLQIATNFNTRPNLNIYPSLTLGGEAGAPSTVDLFINGQLRKREKIESGAFTLEDIPLINGEGQVQMVVTDLFGRQQILSQDYYASSEMLSQGLHDYSYTLGALREDYSYESNNYGNAVFMGRHRYGVSNTFSLGGRFEASAQTLLFGAEAAWLARHSGVINTTLALSDADADMGALLSLGYEYRGKAFAAGGQITGSSSKFTSVGADSGGASPKLQLMLNGSINLGYHGSFGLSYVHQSYHDASLRDDADVVTISHNRVFFRDYYLSIHANLIKAGDTDYNIGMTMTRTLGARKSTSTSADFNRDRSTVRLEARSNVSYGSGYGYRVGTTQGDDKRVDGDFIGQTSFGRYQLYASRDEGGTYWRANGTGSVAWMAGRPYFSREIRNGFAVAKVGEFENVRVYVENHEVGRTDAHGRVLLPALRPFEDNRVSIEPADLPLHVRINSTHMSASPYAGTGTLIEFFVDASRSLMLRAIQTSGEPVPEGSMVHIDGRDAPMMVGLDGLIYINGMNKPQVARVTWRGGACTLEVPIPESDHPLPNIGNVVCEDK